jgi:AraC-like DNA-binding protein
MGDGPEAPPDLKLVFTEDEWTAAVPVVTRDMTEYLARYRTPVFKDHGDHGEGWGSGSFIEVDGSKFILTNEHVATVRSRTHLIRAFRRETGLTPHAYLLDRRFRAASRALGRGEAPAAVALRCGFCDQSHLNRVFKARMGVTPGVYRAA